MCLKGHKAWNKGIIKQRRTGTCKLCSKKFDFYLSKQRGKYCSLSCRNKGALVNIQPYNFAKGIIPWNKGKKLLKISGEKHWNWRGGKTKEKEKARKSVAYKNWRRKVFARDDYTCQFCFRRGLKIEADHIKPWCDYPELRYVVNNGRTLCHACHKTTPTYGNLIGRNQYNKLGAIRNAIG